MATSRRSARRDGRRLVVAADGSADQHARAADGAVQGGARRWRSGRCSPRPWSGSRRRTSPSSPSTTESRRSDFSTLVWIVALFVVAGVASLVASSAQTYFTGWTGERILADLRNGLFRHLQRLSLGYYERNRAGVIISRLTNDVDALDQLVTDGVTTLVQSTLILVGSAVILFLLDWKLALATLAVVPLMLAATAAFRIYSSRAYRAVRERLGHVTATLAEDIAGMRVVQAYTRERANERALPRGQRPLPRREPADGRHERPLLPVRRLPLDRRDRRRARLRRLPRTSTGSITEGTLLAFLLYLSNFFDPVQQLSQLYNTFLAAVAALDKIMDVMDEEPEVRRPGGRDRPPRRSRATSASSMFASATAPDPRCCTASSSTSRRNDGRAGRAHRGRQVDDRQAARALLRAALGPDHDRRARPARRDAGVAPPPARDRAAGGLPVRGHGPRQHRVRAAGRDAAEDVVVAAADGRRARVHRAARGRLRHRARRARDPPLARPAPARRVRPGAARRPGGS